MVVLFVLTSCGSGTATEEDTVAGKPYDYCYAVGDSVFLCSVTGENRIPVPGTDACLSPAGTRLAYTDTTAPDGQRRIAIIRLNADTQTTVYPDTGCHNCFGPMWSPDGKQLAYSAYKDGWNIKCLNLATGRSTTLAQAANTGMGIYAPTWTADSRNIIAQDMDAIYIIGLDGQVKKSFQIRDIDTSLLITSNSRFWLSKEQDRLIYDTETNEDKPTGAVYVYQLATRIKCRLSPQGYDCSHPTIKGDTVFFNGSKDDPGNYETYKVDLNGQGFKKMFRGRDLSMRRNDL